jgi:hypothetical protein
MNQISYSNGRRGAYSPYVGAIVDTARIFLAAYGAFPVHSRAGAAGQGHAQSAAERRPRSAIPSRWWWWRCRRWAPAKPPPLHPVNPAERFCAEKPGLVLPAEGAPLVFATQLATISSCTLRPKRTAPGGSAGEGRCIAGRTGAGAEHPAPPLPEGELTGVLHGKWGFDDWEGRASTCARLSRTSGAWRPRPVGAGGGPRGHAAH